MAKYATSTTTTGASAPTSSPARSSLPTIACVTAPTCGPICLRPGRTMHTDRRGFLRGMGSIALCTCAGEPPPSPSPEVDAAGEPGDDAATAALDGGADGPACT